MSTQKEVLDLILSGDTEGLKKHLDAEGIRVLNAALRSVLNTLNAKTGTPATVKSITYEQELVMLKIKDVLADKALCATWIAADTAKYGEPQCDYSDWQNELNEKLTVLFAEADKLKQA